MRWSLVHEHGQPPAGLPGFFQQPVLDYTTPSRALILAAALGVLPPQVFIVSCQPPNAENLGIGLSTPVA